MNEQWDEAAFTKRREGMIRALGSVVTFGRGLAVLDLGWFGLLMLLGLVRSGPAEVLIAVSQFVPALAAGVALWYAALLIQAVAELLDDSTTITIELHRRQAREKINGAADND